MELTAGERAALENLSRKAGGEEVGWINIADARTLADRGLAMRDRQGWHISPEGVALLAQSPPATPSEATMAPPQRLHPISSNDPVQSKP